MPACERIAPPNAAATTPGQSHHGCGTWSTGKPVGDPPAGHTGSVRAVAAIHPDGRPAMIFGGDDSTVRVWDLAACAHP